MANSEPNGEGEKARPLGAVGSPIDSRPLAAAADSNRPESHHAPASNDADTSNDADAADELLAELLEEFTQRLRRGESPSIAEYRQRHPELAEDIDDIFPSIAAMEKARHESDPPTRTDRADAVP
ncbi:MAG: hypothetical protein KDA83_06375, partial [Planctomycetales bacterium]|nr:hypothetical protein [Planctomycetales bacterium]